MAPGADRASTPYNVAVGGTQFNEATETYWSTNDSSDYTSALRYIPEIAWNESGSVTAGSGLWSTSGGASPLYRKPSRQVAPGVPADSKRDVPEISPGARPLRAPRLSGWRSRCSG